MRKWLRIVMVVLGVWSWAAAAAQDALPIKSSVTPADSAEADGGPDFVPSQTFGFGKAQVVGTDGKTHHVYVPLNALGFGDLVPFFYKQEDITRFGSVPLNISVEKIRQIQAGDLYWEYMVVKGKRQHVVGARMANGPVELFNYTQTKRVPVSANAMGGVTTFTYIVYPKRHWYLRRRGELVEVSRHDFLPQLTQYFQDEPELVAALRSRQYRYRDLAAFVTAYNERRAKAAVIQP